MIKSFIKKIDSRDKRNNIPLKFHKIIPIDKILRGAEGDHLTGLEYVNMTGDKFRTSTRVIDGPQAKLLGEFQKFGSKIFEDDFFCNTDYYKNAIESIHYVGDYFPYAKTPNSIKSVARRFVDSFLGNNISQYNIEGHNKPDDPIKVRPINNSDCFQLISGNHRIASKYFKGENLVKVEIENTPPTETYFSELIGKIAWDEKMDLYQPVNLPEFSNFTLIRKCTDRLELMNQFLAENHLEYKSLLDVGSYYGWFVKQFSGNGVLAQGIEKDFTACRISVDLHSLETAQIIHNTLEDFIQNTSGEYDVILFLSVLHHFVLGKSYLTAQDVFKELSRRTRKCMFFETGEEHEKMFEGGLSGWNEENIKKFILENSDFKKVISLGRDQDGVGRFQNNYSRMLFALIK